MYYLYKLIMSCIMLCVELVVPEASRRGCVGGRVKWMRLYFCVLPGHSCYICLLKLPVYFSLNIFAKPAS